MCCLRPTTEVLAAGSARRTAADPAATVGFDSAGSVAWAALEALSADSSALNALGSVAQRSGFDSTVAAAVLAAGSGRLPAVRLVSDKFADSVDELAHIRHLKNTKKNKD